MSVQQDYYLAQAKARPIKYSQIKSLKSPSRPFILEEYYSSGAAL